MQKKKLNLKAKKVVIGPSGDPEEVILSMETYEKFLEMAEDVADLAWMEAMREEEKDAVPWEDVKKRLKARGLL